MRDSQLDRRPKSVEWVCIECDWIGSPPVKPAECPHCGNVELETITLD
jgi:rubrerythrin